MNRFVRTLAASFGLAVAVGSGLVAIPTAADAAVIGCDNGHACIIRNTPEPLGTPVYDWYYYGKYNIGGAAGPNLYGNYAVCNEQTGGAVLRLYSGPYATGTLLKTIKPDPLRACPQVNMTPVNSVKLSAS